MVLVLMSCTFCTKSHYHNIWTLVRSCCTRVWSGSEAHKLIKVMFWFLNCSVTCMFLWQVKFVAWFIDHNVQQKEDRSGEIETGPLLLREQLSLQKPGSDWSFLWSCPQTSCSKIATSWIWSSTAQPFSLPRALQVPAPAALFLPRLLPFPV